MRGPSNGSDDRDRSVIEEQIAYYDARALEYDETGVPQPDPVAQHGQRLRDELRAFEPRGDVLEIACGTGKWTALLAEFADRVTALDSSPRMLERSREKVAGDRVRHVLADVFSWEPDAAYDVVFFAFWLSHIPPDRFDAFWEFVHRSLGSGGRVFFVDEGRHEHWFEEPLPDDDNPSLVLRRLSDGRTHRAVKVFWAPEELQARLAKLGWSITVQGEGPFYWGTGGRRADA